MLNHNDNVDLCNTVQPQLLLKLKYKVGPLHELFTIFWQTCPNVDNIYQSEQHNNLALTKRFTYHCKTDYDINRYLPPNIGYSP